ncbi:MAG: hypothetical protein ACRBBP_05355 [Bdellovibrionales bacterium]
MTRFHLTLLTILVHLSTAFSYANFSCDVILLRPDINITEVLNGDVVTTDDFLKLKATTGIRSAGDFEAAVDGRMAEIIYYSVPQAFRKFGISKLFFRSLLNKHPEISTIQADLMMTNYDAFRENLPPSPTQISINEAVRNTPFYKALSREGFKKVISAHDTGGEVTVILSR